MFIRDLAAATVVAATAAAVIAAAIAQAVATAAAEQKDQNDDPPATTETVVVTHINSLQKRFAWRIALLIYLIPEGKFGYGSEATFFCPKR